jgi:TRAP-type C4-dicarboxylate transport system substrate-binding protein
MRHVIRTGSAFLALAVVSVGPAHAETTLKAYASMASNLIYTQAYLEYFIKPANEAGKGVFKINFIGGPEVTPINRSAQALKRGVFDISYGPAGYYAGEVPESLALLGTTARLEEVRKNGGWELINEIWTKRIGARVLAWPIYETSYNLFLTKKPKLSENQLDLSGMKLRAPATYKPMIESLGGTPVSIAAPEMYTALERGLVQGSGWPNIGLADTGVAKLLKYKIAPSFYRANQVLIVNKKSWDNLPPKAREILQKVARDYEKNSVAHFKKIQEEELEKLKKAGIETIELSGKARENYLEGGYRALWEMVAKRSDNAKALQEKLSAK